MPLAAPRQNLTEGRVRNLRIPLPGRAVDGHFGREYDFCRRPEATPNGFGALPRQLLPVSASSHHMHAAGLLIPRMFASS